LSAGAIPTSPWAVIGGSGTRSCNFPEDAGAGARILERKLIFETPFGESPDFMLFETAGGRRCLTVALHGWREGVSRGDASHQVFWVLAQAGVKRVISEAGVGSLNPLLNPRDIVIPDDFIDMTTDRSPETVVGGNLLIMRDPVCAILASALAEAADSDAYGKVFDRGTCVVTEGPRFESRAEIRMMRQHGDIIGQSMCPEVWLARDIGACYAALYIVVNYGEGVVRDWDHETLTQIFEEDAVTQSRIILKAIDTMDENASCGCSDLRKPTLLTNP
jgi:5'-methylthioadenosine phosphorylase